MLSPAEAKTVPGRSSRASAASRPAWSPWGSPRTTKRSVPGGRTRSSVRSVGMEVGADYSDLSGAQGCRRGRRPKGRAPLGSRLELVVTDQVLAESRESVRDLSTQVHGWFDAMLLDELQDVDPSRKAPRTRDAQASCHSTKGGTPKLLQLKSCDGVFFPSSMCPGTRRER